MNPTNPGSFMSPTGQPGQGSALMRLMQLRNQGASPQQTAQPVTPPAPPTGGGSVTGGLPQGGGQPVNPQGSLTAGDPNLSIALSALANYTKAHADAHKADHNVPLKEAHGKVIAAQAPQAAPVGK